MKILAATITLFLSTMFSHTQNKNVLFIITDDLNCNIGAYNHYMVKTPNIDKLAQKGMLFNNAFCNFPLCGSSRSGIVSLQTFFYIGATADVKTTVYLAF